MTNQTKKAVKTALFLYPILMGTGGTVMLAVLLLWTIPRDQIPTVALPLSMMGIYIYGSCALAYILRKKFFKGELK